MFMLFYYQALFVFMTAKFLLSLITKLSQFKRARPSTASIT